MYGPTTYLPSLPPHPSLLPRMIMVLGLLWIVFSLGANIFRVFSLHLLSRHTIIEWIPSYADSADRSACAPPSTLSQVLCRPSSEQTFLTMIVSLCV